MIPLQCPHCDKKLVVRDEWAGRLGVCPHCKNRIRLPQAETTADEPADERYSAAPQEESRSPPRRTRRRADADADEREEPVRKRRRPTEDEDLPPEEEEPAPRPVAKPKKKRRKRTSQGFSALDPFLLGLLGVGLLGLLTSGLALIWPAVSFAPLGLGWLVTLVGQIWLLVVAFKEDALQGILCLFVPFYVVYFLITHFEEAKRPFFVWLVGIVVLTMSFCAGGGSASRNANIPRSPRGEHPSQTLRLTGPA
jgi:hypothetical protein